VIEGRSGFLIRVVMQCYVPAPTRGTVMAVEPIVLHYELEALPSSVGNDLAHLFLDASGHDSPHPQRSHASCWRLGVGVVVRCRSRRWPLLPYDTVSLPEPTYSAWYQAELARRFRDLVRNSLSEQRWSLAVALRDGTGPLGGMGLGPEVSAILGYNALTALNWALDGQFRG
jgi:hypothetical protein